ncbi:hypothetical protein [Streptococcus marmotae]
MLGMCGKIRLVEPNEVEIWLGFAKQIWSSDREKLRTGFLSNPFPYEFLYWRGGKALA